jgi:hypothetical protein
MIQAVSDFGNMNVLKVWRLGGLFVRPAPHQTAVAKPEIHYFIENEAKCIRLLRDRLEEMRRDLGEAAIPDLKYGVWQELQRGHIFPLPVGSARK